MHDLFFHNTKKFYEPHQDIKEKMDLIIWVLCFQTFCALFFSLLSLPYQEMTHV